MRKLTILVDVKENAFYKIQYAFMIKTLKTIQKETLPLEGTLRCPVVVVHTFNPSNQGSRGRWISGIQPALRSSKLTRATQRNLASKSQSKNKENKVSQNTIPFTRVYLSKSIRTFRN